MNLPPETHIISSDLPNVNPPKDLPLHEQALILCKSHKNHTAEQHNYYKIFAKNIKEQLTDSISRNINLSELCIYITALYLYDKKQFSGKYFATLAARLVEAESAPGGPYYSSSTLDLETNILVAYLFQVLKKPLPKTQEFIRSHFTSSTFPQLTLFAQHASKAMGLQSNSLWHQSKDLTPWANTFLTKQFVEHSPSPHYFPNKTLHTERLAEIEQDLQTMPLELRSLSHAILKEIRQLDTTQEVVLMPYFFAKAYPHLNPSLIKRLSHANIYCWMAYILYDRLLDGDKTPPESLPLMSFAMRRSQAIYLQTAPTATAVKLIQVTFDTMDATNAWEVKKARFSQQGRRTHINILPRYRQRQPLANRSLGHILGPLLLAHHLGASPAQRKALQHGLHHFLIARQLHDDIHDWAEDMHNGQASFVVTYLLRKCGIKPGIYDPESLLAILRTEFWRQSFHEITAIILQHASLSKKAFAKSKLVPSTSQLVALVENLHKAARQAELEHERYRAFLHEFSDKV